MPDNIKEVNNINGFNRPVLPVPLINVDIALLCSVADLSTKLGVSLQLRECHLRLV